MVAPTSTSSCRAASTTRRGGDQRAFADLYDATVGQVHRLAVLLTDGDRERASELVRRTYGEVWRRAATYRESEGRPLTWVLGLTRSLAPAA